jgi:hypothetical protein
MCKVNNARSAVANCGTDGSKLYSSTAKSFGYRIIRIYQLRAGNVVSQKSHAKRREVNEAEGLGGREHLGMHVLYICTRGVEQGSF